MVPAVLKVELAPHAIPFESQSLEHLDGGVPVKGLPPNLLKSQVLKGMQKEDGQSLAPQSLLLSLRVDVEGEFRPPIWPVDGGQAADAHRVRSFPRFKHDFVHSDAWIGRLPLVPARLLDVAYNVVLTTPAPYPVVVTPASTKGHIGRVQGDQFQPKGDPHVLALTRSAYAGFGRVPLSSTSPLFSLPTISRMVPMLVWYS